MELKQVTTWPLVMKILLITLESCKQLPLTHSTGKRTLLNFQNLSCVLFDIVLRVCSCTEILFWKVLFLSFFVFYLFLHFGTWSKMKIGYKLHFNPIYVTRLFLYPCYIPWKHQKTSGFLMTWTGLRYIHSPRNYRRQKAIAFDIAIEEKIIGSKFLPSIIYLQFAMNLSLFCWIRLFLSYKCLLF